MIYRRDHESIWLAVFVLTRYTRREALDRRKRRPDILDARGLAVRAYRDLRGMSWPEITESFGWGSKTGIRKLYDRARRDRGYKWDLLLELLKEETPAAP